MVYWITGRAGSGKSTLAKRIAKQTNGVILDGEEIRKLYPTGFSPKDIFYNHKRLVDLGKIFEEQGYTAIIACISADRNLRRLAQSQFEKCIEIELPFGEMWEGTEYEESDA